ncbi:hypothetical protein [Saccharopolyspora sp. CA-218241]|uniref:hypothetical protein n=1 Tax=Saccharopolyspora sp. CA-218241 TaxID=3240027 RepID=UPI003D98AB3E
MARDADRRNPVAAFFTRIDRFCWVPSGLMLVLGLLSLIGGVPVLSVLLIGAAVVLLAFDGVLNSRTPRKRRRGGQRSRDEDDEFDLDLDGPPRRVERDPARESRSRPAQAPPTRQQRQPGAPQRPQPGAPRRASGPPAGGQRPPRGGGQRPGTRAR